VIGVTDETLMRCTALSSMTLTLKISAREWLRVLCLGLMLALGQPSLPMRRRPRAIPLPPTPPRPAYKDTIVSTTPMEFVAEDSGVHGQFVVAPEILSGDTRNDLVYTITTEPQHGRVGLAGGGDEVDFFKNKTSRLGYFAYRAQDDYAGTDSFGYTVRNETSGLIFKNTVAITVKSAGPLVMQKFEVSAARGRSLTARPVSLTTRPNTPVAQKVPSHEDFMSLSDRTLTVNPKVAYVLDDKIKSQNGTAKLDRVTGQLTYAPNPGFIGEDRFKYYTFDENNSSLGVENSVTVTVEPIRTVKHIAVDRSRSREGRPRVRHQQFALDGRAPEPNRRQPEPLSAAFPRARSRLPHRGADDRFVNGVIRTSGPRTSPFSRRSAPFSSTSGQPGARQPQPAEAGDQAGCEQRHPRDPSGDGPALDHAPRRPTASLPSS